MKIPPTISTEDLRKSLAHFWTRSAASLRATHANLDPAAGSPVFTVRGHYTSRGWTEWTQGFQYGSPLLHFDATDDRSFLRDAYADIWKYMPAHVTHMGVHDHGFNTVSTFGNLWRLINEGRAPEWASDRRGIELAIACSGAVQARRWTALPEGGGYVYSFNGPHSLFADTIRSMRVLALGHQLGHVLMEEQDRKISLLQRLIEHAQTTARYIVFYGEHRDAYDVRGRVVHEAIFNLNDGCFRCPSSQQGYSPFTTWTRGHAWILCGYAELLEYLETRPAAELEPFGGWTTLSTWMRKVAEATAEFYVDQTPLDGIPYWDTGAPGLAHMGDYLSVPADPFNAHEPVDSSAAAIAAQGLLRLGHFLQRHDAVEQGARYERAGLAVLSRLISAPYLNEDDAHEGLLLHTIYHRPNGWDHIPDGHSVPCGESCQWGDYHLRELALMAQRKVDGAPGYAFWGQQAIQGAP